MSDDLAVPAPPDEVTSPFWEATSRHELVLQRCACGHYQHYPRPVCMSCGGDELSFVTASGAGRVYAHSTVYRAPTPGLEPPYVVALVDLEEGPRMLSRLVGDTSALRCGTAVQVRFEPLADGRALPLFELVERDDGARR